MTPTSPPPPSSSPARRALGRLLSAAIISAAVLLSAVTLRTNARHPRTDDATARANVVGIAPRVSGRILALAVADNQLVREGELLFEVDPQPYRFALERALSQHERLEQQIATTRRHVAAQADAVLAASAARARAAAQLQQAENTLARLEPLLSRRFATAEQVDQARTARRTAEAALEQARAEERRAENLVDDLGALEAQRREAEALVASARYDLESCRVFAPFEGRVVNLNLSRGAFAHAAGEVLTLLDVRQWFVLANFRESALHHIQPGARADVWVLAGAGRRYQGTVQGVGWAVQPDDGGRLSGLPNVARALNWVHLSQRFPVRVRLEAAGNDEVLRLGASAVVTILGAPAEPASAPR